MRWWLWKVEVCVRCEQCVRCEMCITCEHLGTQHRLTWERGRRVCHELSHAARERSTDDHQRRVGRSRRVVCSPCCARACTDSICFSAAVRKRCFSAAVRKRFVSKPHVEPNQRDVPLECTIVVLSPTDALVLCHCSYIKLSHALRTLSRPIPSRACEVKHVCQDTPHNMATVTGGCNATAQ